MKTYTGMETGHFSDDYLLFLLQGLYSSRKIPGLHEGSVFWFRSGWGVVFKTGKGCLFRHGSNPAAA